LFRRPALELTGESAVIDDLTEGRVREADFGERAPILDGIAVEVEIDVAHGEGEGVRVDD